MYKLKSNEKTGVQSVVRTEDGACIPFDPANTDYQAFKKDVLAGVELQDPDGVAMSHDDAVTFIKTLP